jgi:predicted transcriptional regulator of viral defense system
MVEVQGRARPDWSAVRVLAAGQEGHFTVAQAVACGFSEQLLSKHVAAGNLARPLRGIYRLAYFPPGENEDLVVAWLWSGEEAVVSHESALQLHGLSDAMPSRVHLSLPTAWRARRRVVPPLYLLHFADLGPPDHAWIGAVPVTTPSRTVLDVAAAHGDAGLVRQAIDEGLRRGHFRVWDVVPAIVYAQGFAR